MPRVIGVLSHKEKNGYWNYWRKLHRKIHPCRQAEISAGRRGLYWQGYLQFAKNEAIAKKLFQEKLEDAASGAHIVYVISEKEHLPLLPDGAFRVLVTANLDVIKERFAQRMRGNLPAPVATMLERKHGCFDAEICDIHVVSGRDDLDEVCISIQNRVDSL